MSSGKPKRARKQVEPTGDWVKPARVAALFDMSVDYVTKNALDLSIRTTLIGTSDLRMWWPDALAESERRLKSATKDAEFADGKNVFDVRRARSA
ncbi:MAG TPA: hypothetical protein VF747_03475 [Blastocatellia bacterium]|jgi:hypothetical protein